MISPSLTTLVTADSWRLAIRNSKRKRMRLPFQHWCRFFTTRFSRHRVWRPGLLLSEPAYAKLTSLLFQSHAHRCSFESPAAWPHGHTHTGCVTWKRGNWTHRHQLQLCSPSTPTVAGSGTDVPPPRSCTGKVSLCWKIPSRAQAGVALSAPNVAGQLRRAYSWEVCTSTLRTQRAWAVLDESSNTPLVFVLALSRLVPKNLGFVITCL